MNFITLALNASDQLLMDLLTTCYEGGSAYWLACENVRRDKELNVLRIIGCEESEPADEDCVLGWGDADLTTMYDGIQRIMDGSVPVRADIRNDLIAAMVDVDSCQWDAETADIVLQAGLLKEIVYG